MSSTTPASAELADGEWELFRYSNDPFVNEGAVQLGRQLALTDLARIDRRAVIATAPPERVLPKLRAELFGSEGVITNTHRRTSRAYHVNALATGTLAARDDDGGDPDWLGESETESGATIPAPTGPYPDDTADEATVFPENDLSDDTLEEFGLDAAAIDRAGDNAYSFHPAYLGPQRSDQFANERAERYLDILADVLTTDEEEEVVISPTCMCCGSSLPNWTWELDDDEYDDKDIEYSQSFTPLVTRSGRPRPLGQKSSKASWYRGRCPACLLAGFYYGCMPTKPVASTSDSGVYRVFTVEGDFETIAAVRRAYEQTVGLTDLAAPSSDGTIRTSSFPVWSSISEVQGLAFFSTLLRALAADNTDTEALFAETSPDRTESTVSLTGGVSFRSNPSKSGRPVRGLAGFDEIPATADLYDRLRKRERDTPDGRESYEPFRDVLAWYFRIQNPNTDAEVGVGAKRDLAQGVFDGDLRLFERSLFGLLKRHAGDAAPPYRLSISRHQHYFETIMAEIATHIDDETRNSIQIAGSSVGQMFAERDDLSVLQSFRHASSPDQFLSAMEKAGMGAAKKSHDPNERVAHSTWIANTTVDDLLGAIIDEETFEAAKQMFVIHASLSAHYQNSTANDNDGDD